MSRTSVFIFAEPMHVVGRSRILSGGRTFTLFATLGQFGFNELNLLRIRYVSRRNGYLNSDGVSGARDIENPQYSPKLVKPPLSQRLTEGFFSYTFIRKVSDEEFSQTLRKNLERVQVELSIVSHQLEDAEKLLEEARAQNW